MAIAYLNDGATSMAAGNWSDATGFAAAATLVVASGSQSIVSDIDNSAQSYNMLYMTVQAPFVGNLGTAASPHIANYSDGTAAQKTSANTEGYFYYGAGGGNCFLRGDTDQGFDNLIVDSQGGRCVWIAGTNTYLDVVRGTYECVAAGVVVNATIRGGSSIIETNSSTAMTTLVMTGGTCVLRRACSVGGASISLYGGRLIYDANTSTTTTINQYGGELVWISGNGTTVNQYAGSIDLSSARKAVAITTWNRGPTATRKGQFVGGLVTITNDNGVPIKRD